MVVRHLGTNANIPSDLLTVAGLPSFFLFFLFSWDPHSSSWVSVIPVLVDCLAAVCTWPLALLPLAPLFSTVDCHPYLLGLVPTQGSLGLHAGLDCLTLHPFISGVATFCFWHPPLSHPLAVLHPLGLCLTTLLSWTQPRPLWEGPTNSTHLGYLPSLPAPPSPLYCCLLILFCVNRAYAMPCCLWSLPLD